MTTERRTAGTHYPSELAHRVCGAQDWHEIPEDLVATIIDEALFQTAQDIRSGRNVSLPHLGTINKTPMADGDFGVRFYPVESLFKPITGLQIRQVQPGSGGYGPLHEIRIPKRCLTQPVVAKICCALDALEADR